MVDLLTAWGVTSAAGFIFKPILQDLYEEIKKLTKYDIVGAIRPKGLLKDTASHIAARRESPLPRLCFLASSASIRKLIGRL